MLSRRSALKSALAFGALMAAGATLAAPRGGPLKALDADNDGTVDLAEAKKAAESIFDSLEKDSDGTLDRKELRRRISATDFKAADTDHDGTLSKDEYLALVEQRFKAADADNDGTLSAAEIKSKAGKALLRLVK